MRKGIQLRSAVGNGLYTVLQTFTLAFMFLAALTLRSATVRLVDFADSLEVCLVFRQPHTDGSIDGVNLNRGHARVCQLLLEGGANVNADACGSLPIHGAAFQGHTDVVDLLLRFDSRINARDWSYGDGRTPLHKACLEGAWPDTIVSSAVDAASSS